MRISQPLILLALTTLAACRKDPLPPAPSAGTPATRIKVIHDTLEGRPLVVAGERTLDIAVSFYNETTDGRQLTFAPVQDKLPVMLEDTEGSRWNIWGEAVSGPRKGEKLKPARSMTAYWFTWGAFYPGCAIYAGPNISAPALPPGEGGWLIPESRINRGALPGAIPPIHQPKYVQKSTDVPAFLKGEDYVLVMKFADQVFLFPHPVLQWHEVVNDVQAGIPFTLLFCPFTGSACAFQRPDASDGTRMEISGLLYNSNMIAYEYGTKSYWSQFQQRGVYGPRKGEMWPALQVIETTFETAARLFKGYKMLSDDTGFQREYGNFPSGDYFTNHDKVLYPIDFDDPRLPRKERVFGVLENGQAKVYPFSVF